MNQETAPIDVMLLVHTAMAGSAERVEREADQLQEGSSIHPFRAAFNEWAAAFMYLSEREDDLFSGHAGNRAEAATTEDGEQAAVLAANKDEHREMDEKFQDVMEVLNVEIGRTSVIRRTRQHLFGSVPRRCWPDNASMSPRLRPTGQLLHPGPDGR